jgi:non-ribosomal peptide synthetase component F
MTSGIANHYSKRSIAFSEEISAELNHFAKINKTTLNTIFQAGWALLLHKYSGNNDVVFGATFSGRPATLDGADNMVGLFINTLPIRAEIDKKLSISDWLADFNSSVNEIKEFEHSALVDIQNVSDLPAKQNLFDTLFVFENYPIDSTLIANDFKLKFEELDTFEQANYPLTVISSPGKLLKIDIAYNNELFDGSYISLLLEHYKNILTNVVKSPQIRICDIDYLTRIEKDDLLPFKFGSMKYSEDEVIIKEFEKVAKELPDNVAVRFDGTELTYGQLNLKANKLANYLLSMDIGLESMIGLYVDRSIEMIISILAILKTGAAYVPIDINYPNDRVNYILRDAKLNYLITETELSDQISFPKEKILHKNELANVLTHYSEINTEIEIQPENIAYVIYTSGSTGKPKGTLVPNKGVYNFLMEFSDVYNLNEQLAALFYVNVSDQLRLGYSVEIPLTAQQISRFGSHEIGLHYLFRKAKKQSISPRYF